VFETLGSKSKRRRKKKLVRGNNENIQKGGKLERIETARSKSFYEKCNVSINWLGGGRDAGQDGRGRAHNAGDEVNSGTNAANKVIDGGKGKGKNGAKREDGEVLARYAQLKSNRVVPQNKRGKTVLG